MRKQIGIIGLGKMGSGIALQLAEKGWEVVGYNRSPEKIENLAGQGIKASFSLRELVEKLKTPRVIWVMVPHGNPVEEVIFSDQGLISFLDEEDIIIDAGNSNYKNSIGRHNRLSKRNLRFVDVGVSGGPSGARNGACMMIGGYKKEFNYLERVYKDTCIENGYKHFEGVGAGHFVKMVHNGIEYGMMQAIAEGFDIMKNSKFNLNLTKAANVYNHGSVIESRLVEWLFEAYTDSGNNLQNISGSAGQGGKGAGEAAKGEADWTVETAKELGIDVEVIKKAIKARTLSRKEPNYQGRIINALRNQFGGHRLKADEPKSL